MEADMRKNWADLYFAGKTDLANVPELSGGQQWRATIASRALKMIGLSQGAAASVITQDTLDFGLTTLAQLGYEIDLLDLPDGASLWTKISTEPKFQPYYGFITLAIPKCSQWYRIPAMLITIVTVPETVQLPQPYRNVVYTWAGISHVGHGINPAREMLENKALNPNFKVWQEPFTGVRTGKGRYLNVTEIQRLAILNGTPVKVYQRNLENGRYDDID
jgi:hypothetical protein